MTQGASPTELALHRLLAIVWSSDYSRIKSQVQLMKEFLRRAACWAKTIERRGSWPFFDIPIVLAPDQQMNIVGFEKLEKLFQQKHLTSAECNVCQWYLRWSALANSLPEEFARLPAPYEPLVVLWERGGRFHNLDHMCVDVNGLAGIPRKNPDYHFRPEPIVELDKATLDALDFDQTED